MGRIAAVNKLFRLELQTKRVGCILERLNRERNAAIANIGQLLLEMEIRRWER